MAINIVVIAMHLGLLCLECASLYIFETITKPTFYSIKLKLESAILGKLDQFVGGRESSHQHTRLEDDDEKGEEPPARPQRSTKKISRTLSTRRKSTPITRGYRSRSDPAHQAGSAARI